MVANGEEGETKSTKVQTEEREMVVTFVLMQRLFAVDAE